MAICCILKVNAVGTELVICLPNHGEIQNLL